MPCSAELRTLFIITRACAGPFLVYIIAMARHAIKRVRRYSKKQKLYAKMHMRSYHFYTPPLKYGGVLCYTFRCLSVRPCSPFPIDNLSIYSRNFFKFCIHIVIGDEWYGIVNGQNPSIFNGVTALFRIGKWFLACYSFTVHDI